jgi:hypothetical protein
MSKGHQHKQSITPIPVVVPVASSVEMPISSVSQSPVRREVPLHQQCPWCYHGLDNGIGEGVSTPSKNKERTVKIMYFKCDKCSGTWHVPKTIKYGEIQINTVPIQFQAVNLTTR